MLSVILIKIGCVVKGGGCFILSNKQSHQNTYANLYLLLNFLSGILVLVVLVSKREAITARIQIPLSEYYVKPLLFAEFPSEPLKVNVSS